MLVPCSQSPQSFQFSRPSTIAISSSVNPYNSCASASISWSVASIWRWHWFLSGGGPWGLEEGVDELHTNLGLFVVGARVDVEVAGEALHQVVDLSSSRFRRGCLRLVSFGAQVPLLLCVDGL